MIDTFTFFSVLVVCHYIKTSYAAIVILILLPHGDVVLGQQGQRSSALQPQQHSALRFIPGIKWKHILHVQRGKPNGLGKSSPWVYMHTLLSAHLRLQMCKTAWSRPRCTPLI